MDASLRFGVLGPLLVERGGRPVELRSRTRRALLATMLSRANLPLANDLLIDAVWEEGPPVRALDTLRVHVSQLRRVLGADVIVTLTGGYALRVDPDAIDSHRFEEDVRSAVEAAGDGHDQGARQALADALSRWRGDPYDDARYLDALQSEIRRLRELWLDALELHADVELRLGLHERLVPLLTEQTAAHPYRERLWARLMLALYRSGRQADAINAYRRASAALHAELGVEPGEELQRLAGQITRREPAAELAGSGSRLPAPVTSFVGRTRELAEAVDAIGHARLVTFVGIGGTGKTRLAIETARRAARTLPDGPWFVDLSGAGPDDHLAALIGAAVSPAARPVAGELDTLVDGLRDRHGILLLDNCEHLVEPIATLVSLLLARCPALRVLATSRERLGIPGEIVYRVPPMHVAGHGVDIPLDGDAMRLFEDRARAAVPGFRLDEQTLPAARALVAAVDGLPLAIELAACRLATMPLDRLVSGVRSAMPDLGTDARVAVPRHATIRATFTWSYQQLGEPERSLFADLWVFRGGWTIASLTAVTGLPEGEVFGRLTHLADVSLVEVLRRGAEVRYDLLEPVRQFARTLADETQARRLRGSHARVHREVAASLPVGLGRGDAGSLRRLEAEESNLVAALAWFLESGEDDGVAGLAATLLAYWNHVGQHERARDWYRRLAPGIEQASPRTRAVVRAHAAWTASVLGDQSTAESLLTAAETDARADGAGDAEARVLNQRGNIHGVRGEMRMAAHAFEASIDAARRVGRVEAELPALVNLAAVRTWMGNTRTGERLALLVGAIGDERGDPALAAMSLLLRGQAALFADHPADAERWLADGAPLLARHAMHAIHALGALWQGMTALALDRPAAAAAFAREAEGYVAGSASWPTVTLAPLVLAWSSLAVGDIDEARRLATSVGHLSLRAGNLGGMARSLELLATLEDGAGDPDRAALLLGAAAAGRRALALARAPHERRAVEALERSLVAELGKRRFTARHREGSAFDLPVAMNIAIGATPPSGSSGPQASGGERPSGRR